MISAASAASNEWSIEDKRWSSWPPSPHPPLLLWEEEVVLQPSLQGRVGREAVVGSRFLVEHQLCQDFKLLAVFVEIDKSILLKTETLIISSTETSWQSFVPYVWTRIPCANTQTVSNSVSTSIRHVPHTWQCLLIVSRTKPLVILIARII